MSALLFDLDEHTDAAGVVWRTGSAWEANVLLARHHYLGPLTSGGAELTIIGADSDGTIVAAMIWRRPTSRRLPADGTWLELSRWCLTPAAGDSAGSRMHRASVRLIKARYPHVTTLVSYSDPSHGHTGSLYRACNWQWAPTWQRLRPPPSGGGAWQPGKRQEPKDRWVFCLRRDALREALLAVGDAGAIRFWRACPDDPGHRWAARSICREELSA